ncbi:MAG: TonB-dependent receptor domain-containing protein [Gemmatimonadota bacterium]
MRAILFLSALITGMAAPLAAQNATLIGRVTDSETGQPLAGATVQALDGGVEVAGAVTDGTGEARVELPAGRYSVVVALLGYGTERRDGVRLAAGATERLAVALASRALELNPVVVSVSRRKEKALQAPASVAIVEAEEIALRSAPTTVEHVRGLPGVDLAQTGIQQANVVTRGFNNVFSGAMLVLTDNRYAHVPSLRVNAYNFIPTTNLDLERIEVVLGPGAALYGPNSAHGVLHQITTSPIDAPGTRFSLAGGERALRHAEARHAVRFSDRVGFKLSGQYFQANDWRFIDPVEATARQAALVTDPDTRIGLRNFDAERWSADARLDVRPWDDGEVIVAAGTNLDLHSIELTGIGAGQAEDWRYSYGQVRVRKGRLFAQTFGNLSDAGDTYILRTGNGIIDKSRFLAGQVQHGLAIGGRADVIYGVDLQRTDPRPEGTIVGRNEDDDAIKEAGGYIHTETELTEKLDLVGAVRLDWNNRLEDPVFSPRAALVFRPAVGQNLRLTFNRAFSTPTSNNLFLDIVAARIPLGPGLGFDVRTRGTPESGFTFSPDCPGGVLGGLCMFSPFAPGVRAPARAAVAFNALINALAPAQLRPLLPLLQSDNPPIETVLRRLDAETGTFVDDPLGPADIDRLRPTITNTIELGYKGLVGERVLLAADVYRSDLTDFIGPLRVETSTVFLDPATTAAFLQQRLTPLVAAGQLTAQQLAGLIQQITGELARVPIGTIAPDQNPNSDLLLAYRNFGDVELWGADLAAQVLVTDAFSLLGSFSFVNEECFDFSGDGECGSALDIALNAPKTKGSLTARWDDPRRGFTTEGRVRFTSSFPMNSGVYIGEVDGYTVLDANLGYRLPWVAGTSVTLTATNVLNKEHREFVGAPELGRLVVLRLLVDLP